MRNCSNVGSLESFKLIDDIGVLPQEYVESVLGLTNAPAYSVLITGMLVLGSCYQVIWILIVLCVDRE